MPLPVVKAATDEAHRKDKLVFAHPSTIEGVELVIAGHVDVLAHTSEEADKWDEALSARLKAANVTLIPTLTLFSRDDSFDSILKEIKSYSDAHGQIMFGTDIGYLNDYSALTKEFGYMARAGMTFPQILASLTTTPADLRTLVAHDASLSKILLRAFMLRRLMLIDRQLGNVVVIGSRHSADTLRLREFLTRNGHPFSYIDLDMDDAYRNLLDRFEIAVSEIPIVIGNGTMVLRNPSTSQLADSLGLNDNIDNSSLHDLIIVGAGPCRPGSSGIRGLGGNRCSRYRKRRPRGAGGLQFKDRELSGISNRSLRSGARYKRHQAGTEVWSEDGVGTRDCST